MVSKLVVDRERSSRSVQAISEAQLPAITKGIGLFLSPVMAEGETLPDVEVLVRLFLRKLATDTAGMMASDATDALEDADLARGWTKHKETSAALRDELVDAREIAMAVVGFEGATLLGFVGPTPEVPVAMERLAQTVAARLRDKDRLPAPRSPKLTWDTEVIAAALDTAREACNAAAKVVSDEEREGQVSQEAKDGAIEGYDDSFRRAASLITILFEVAGHDALADKVRPSLKRPGRTSVAAGVPEA